MHLPLDCSIKQLKWVGMEQVKSNRGFASMDRTRQREIASKGGHGVPPEKRSFSKNRELAAAAGRKGGESRAQLFNPRHEAARRRQLKKEGDEQDEQQEQDQPQEETTKTA